MLSQQKLAQTLLLKMRMRYPDNEFTLRVSSDQKHKAYIDIHYDDSKTFTCSMGTLYSMYQKNPDGLKEYCEQMLATVKDLITSAQAEKSLLLPMIVNQKRLAEIQTNHLQEKHASILTGDPSTPFIPLVADLFIIFVLDTASRIIHPTVEQLRQILPYQNIQEAYQTALKNLLSLLPELDITPSPFGHNLHLDSNYELSFLLIFDHWKGRLPFSAPPVIAAAARDTIILADSMQPKQVEMLEKMLQQTYNHIDQNISSQLLTIYNGEIQPLKDTQ